MELHKLSPCLLTLKYLHKRRKNHSDSSEICFYISDSPKGSNFKKEHLTTWWCSRKHFSTYVCIAKVKHFWEVIRNAPWCSGGLYATPGLCGRRAGTEQSGQYLQATASPVRQQQSAMVTLETQQCTVQGVQLYNTVQWPDLCSMVPLSLGLNFAFIGNYGKILSMQWAMPQLCKPIIRMKYWSITFHIMTFLEGSRNHLTFFLRAIVSIQILCSFEERI